MNRNRLGGGRDRIGRGYSGGDGLLGEGPGMGGALFEPMVNSQVNQLMLAQQLLQQQAALGGVGNFGGGDYGMGNFGAMGNARFLQQQRGFIGKGVVRNDRKRRGGDRDRSRGRDSNRSSESRDVNRSDKDQDKDQAGKSKRDCVQSEATEEQDKKDKDKEKDGNLFCHVCNVSVYDEDSFRRHMNGSKHAQRMNSLLTVHQLKSNQLKSRLQAEEHLRKIESKAGGVDPEFFCKICNNSLIIPWDRHRFSNIHKQRQLQVKRGCGWCKVHDFTNFSEVLKHRETEEHKKNAELYGKKKNGSDRSRSRSGSREGSEDDEDLSVPEYNPENPVGVNYIIPVTGFFCKLCNKFYNNEKSAKGSHCQSEAHYDKFKLATEAKQEAREKRLLEEAAAAAALNEKSEQEKAKREKGDNMDDEREENEEEKVENSGEENDDEDYDDDLPLEDKDNDGGLMDDDDDKADISKDATSHGSFLNETSANSSFVFLSGDVAQDHMEVQRQQQNLLNQFDDDDDAGGPRSSGEQVVTQYSNSQSTIDDASMDLSGEGEDREDDASTLSDEESAATEKLSAKSRAGASARRGHGKGKAKK